MFEILNKGYIKKLLFLFGDQAKFVPLLLLSFLLASLIDFIGIGFVGPFLALFLNPESLIDRFSFLEPFSASALLIYAGVFLIVIFVLSLTIFPFHLLGRKGLIGEMASFFEFKLKIGP